MSELPVILITGTSRGLGKYLVEHFCRHGYRVIGCSRSGESIVSHPQYSHCRVDISKEQDVRELFQKIREEYRRLDIVINNAAINTALSLALMTPFQSAVETMAVNFLGTFIISRESAKLMMRRKFGRIINISSMAVRHEVAGESIYTSSKAAVHALTRVLAKELYPNGITCNVVAPAAVPTPMMETVDKVALKEVLRRNAIPEVGELKDVVQTIEWLIRPESCAITGQVIYLGGV